MASRMPSTTPSAAQSQPTFRGLPARSPSCSRGMRTCPSAAGCSPQAAPRGARCCSRQRGGTPTPLNSAPVALRSFRLPSARPNSPHWPPRRWRQRCCSIACATPASGSARTTQTLKRSARTNGRDLKTHRSKLRCTAKPRGSRLASASAGLVAISCLGPSEQCCASRLPTRLPTPTSTRGTKKTSWSPLLAPTLIHGRPMRRGSLCFTLESAQQEGRLTVTSLWSTRPRARPMRAPACWTVRPRIRRQHSASRPTPPANTPRRWSRVHPQRTYSGITCDRCSTS
mmetsp:Transcript_3139/g.10508  ORF Transcript_3139/g.10508 Transcript_3139/m.10508 type:complete len:285 (-) Transcript_3139:329-1183(-)